MNDATPSWAASSAPAPKPERARPPITLVAACWLAAAEGAAEVVHLAGRDELTPGLRVFVALIVGAKLPLARAALRLSSVGAMGLFLYEATSLTVAAVGGFDGTIRVVLAVVAFAVGGLLAASLHAFPTPELPRLGVDP